MLNPEQQRHAIEIAKQYLDAPVNSKGQTPPEVEAELDRNRREIIERQLKPLLNSYLAGTTPLATFKSTIDGLNKRHEYWGFKGIKGQMFFNMVVNTATDPKELDHELRAALSPPPDDETAKSRIRNFVSYAKRLGDQHVDSGGSAHGRPKLGSAPFFLSYFWQIADRDKWPVFYTNSVQVMEDMNLWQQPDDLGESYVEFKRIQEELCQLLSKATGTKFGLYDVEHVFWFKAGNQLGDTATTPMEAMVPTPALPANAVVAADGRLPDSYVPPIVAVLPQMALNTPALIESAKASGTSLEKAFEKHINAAFTILGYHTQLLGQGHGRVPDGLATDLDNSYAIIWDAKVRTLGYSIGTDDRVIREYIKTQSRELKRRKSLRNIYYVIISSRFGDDYDEIIRELKMETDVNEVCLLTAAGLVAMVDQKLRDPHQISLGPDGIQRLFSSSGVLDAADVMDILT